MVRYKEVKPGAHLGDIGHAIQTYAESNGYSVVREFCGHGIGKVFMKNHKFFITVNWSGIELKPGMIFTIEPMINAGKRDIKMLPDGWTVVTKDGRFLHNGNIHSSTEVMEYEVL